MLATLLLLSISFPILGAQILINCTHKSLCQRALLSGNDIVLQCDHPRALWYFSSILGEVAFPLSSMSNIKELPGGSLQLTNPQPSQTGLYRCQDSSGALLVQFKIDFQDATTLHITHKGLGQEPLENETLNPGSGQLIFTRWEPWQDCNRCGAPGERKRLGYCYIEEPPEEPRPCWLHLREVEARSSRMRPELQVEACFVLCDQVKETNQPFFIFDLHQLGQPTNMWLTCPLASIYRPTYWEANGTLLTWQSQLSGEDFSNVLDPTNGGMRLQIFQPAIYRCFVQQELMARFNPLTPPEMWTLQRDEQEAGEGQNGKAGVVLKGLTLALLAGTVLVLAAVLLKFLRPSWGKRSERVLLVK
ncbi:protein FAM187B isoform X2 [Dasypus novemcinctus]|uniref:protein FAM187B isoform X2 n=1 Tax=Dasypus novemcinctus TaxID=9361 RepID=UPI00265E8C87|nr:protein FAM187B isoform X2 [Dasypus novemcinctus]